MAHGISFAGITGQAEAVYRNRPAWHRLGRVFESTPGDRLTSDKALALSGLDWQVSMESLLTATGIVVEGFNATVRQDTKEVLGIVGDRYQIWQNRDAFAFLDSFVQDGAIEYEAAFALHGGRQVVLVARMPSVDEITENDNCMRYILARLGHDGTVPCVLQPTTLRVECANLLRIALSETRHQIAIKHTASMTDRLEQARRYLSQFDEKFTEFRDSARKLAEMKYTDADAQKYLASLFPVPADSASDHAKTRAENRIETIRKAFRNPTNQLPAMRGTWWQLVNTVTYYVDHMSKPRGKDQRSKAENLFDSISDGQGADLKDKAMQLAVAMAV